MSCEKAKKWNKKRIKNQTIQIQQQTLMKKQEIDSMSLSSAIVSSITAFRNPNGPEQEWTQGSNTNLPNLWKLAIAEVGYIITIPFAIIETAIAAIAKLFSVCLPIGQANHAKMSDWLKSSSFSIIWSAGDALINFLCVNMIQTERVARACAASGDIFRVPLEAL